MKTIRLFLFIIASGSSVLATAQSLRDINYSYLYDGSTPFSFSLKPVRQANGWAVFFKLQSTDTTIALNTLSIQWDQREELSEKEGKPLLDQVSDLKTSPHSISGRIAVGLSAHQQIIVAKVIHSTTKKLWTFYTALMPDHSVNDYLKTSDNSIILEPYTSVKNIVSLEGFSPGEPLIISHYGDVFPTAAPAFSEGLARVNAAIKPDTIFTVMAGQQTSFTKKGLYLAQRDTTTVEGLAFRIEDGYPKFKHLQDLVGPFIYVCAKDEYDKMRMAGNDKKQFDKGVLAITRDADRAREFMKVYFSRAEVANHLFTSYKEGWRTDRGMIYLIYGPPPTVFKFIDREVWTYGKTTFTFTKSSTLFDPDNFVLIRNKKYAAEWYEKVDLIRNSRF